MVSECKVCHWTSPSFSVFLQVAFTWRILDLWGKKGRRGDEEKETLGLMLIKIIEQMNYHIVFMTL